MVGMTYTVIYVYNHVSEESLESVKKSQATVVKGGGKKQQ